MRPLLDELRARLEEIDSAGLHRSLVEPRGIDFSSNDYLGLASHPRLREAILESLREGPLSAPASRLLRGTLPEHRDLEERLARFKGVEACLLFPSGYQANLGLLSALIGPRDRVISDEANHASIIDALRLSRCEKVVIPHLDAGALEDALRVKPEAGRNFIVTESLFSMDGDVAPLDLYADLADRHGASLIVDDAHATGVYGPARGSGLAETFQMERRAAAIVSTCGKALGLSGAFVGGSSTLVDYLINKSRAFIFSTAISPLLLAGIDAALDIVAAEPERRARTLALAARLRRLLGAGGVDCARSEGPIVPVVLGENERALRVAEVVRRRGHDVRAIRPPSVAEGTARLRISVHADHTEEQIEGLAAAVLDGARTAGAGAFTEAAPG